MSPVKTVSVLSAKAREYVVDKNFAEVFVRFFLSCFIMSPLILFFRIKDSNGSNSYYKR